MRRLRPAVVEQVVFVALAALATVQSQRPLLFEPHVYQDDAMLHEYWMRRWQDPHLFTDPLTHALINAGYVPLGVQGIYWIASFVVDPVRFGAWGALVTAPFSAWLLFRICRELTDWKPAAWIGAAMFLMPWDLNRYSGTHARAFGQPVVLLALLLLLRRRYVWAAIVPVVGSLLYPPAAIVALGVVASSALSWTRRRLILDRRIAAIVAASGAGCLVAVLLPRLTGLQNSQLISGSVAHHYPEFGPHGQLPMFFHSLGAMLRRNYSGFDLRSSGSIIYAAGAAVLLIRPSNVRLLPKEVWAVPVVSLVLFAASYLVLFRLYLPNRYTYPLIPFMCILVAVAWRPTWQVIGRRLWLWLLPATALVLPAVIVWLGTRFLILGSELTPLKFRHMFSSGKTTLAVAAVVPLVVAAVPLWKGRRLQERRMLVIAAAAVLSGSLLVGAVAVAGKEGKQVHCGKQRLMAFIRTLPKSAIIAGDPASISCVPIDTNRPVVISRKLYQVIDANFFRDIRPRMFAMLNAYYGDSRPAIARLRARYGADYLIVDTTQLTRPPARYNGMAPFGDFIHHLLKTDGHPAVLHLPAACSVWHKGSWRVYDLRCVGDSGWFGSAPAVTP